jgi:hypothetical protein
MGTSRWDQGRPRRRRSSARARSPRKRLPRREILGLARQVLVCPSCPPAPGGRAEAKARAHAGPAPWLRTSSGGANSRLRGSWASTPLWQSNGLSEFKAGSFASWSVGPAGQRGPDRSGVGPIDSGGGEVLTRALGPAGTAGRGEERAIPAAASGLWHHGRRGCGKLSATAKRECASARRLQ